MRSFSNFPGVRGRDGSPWLPEWLHRNHRGSGSSSESVLYHGFTLEGSTWIHRPCSFSPSSDFVSTKFPTKVPSCLKYLEWFVPCFETGYFGSSNQNCKCISFWPSNFTSRSISYKYACIWRKHWVCARFFNALFVNWHQ